MATAQTPIDPAVPSVERSDEPAAHSLCAERVLDREDAGHRVLEVRRLEADLRGRCPRLLACLALQRLAQSPCSQWIRCDVDRVPQTPLPICAGNVPGPVHGLKWEEIPMFYTPR